MKTAEVRAGWAGGALRDQKPCASLVSEIPDAL